MGARRFLLLLALAAPAAAQPSSFTPRQCEDPDSVRTLAKLRALDAPAPRTLEAEIDARFVLDQAVRQRLMKAFTGPKPEMECAGGTFVAVDRSNSRALERLFPGATWFETPAPLETMRRAATILQHHDDPAFMAAKLLRFRAIAYETRAYGGQYARLHDRVAVQAGHPQRYATQARCEAGRTSFFPIEDEPRVTEHRTAIAFTETREQTEARLGVGKPC